MRSGVAGRMRLPHWIAVGLIGAFLFVFMIWPVLYVFFRSFFIDGKVDFYYFTLIFTNDIYRTALVNSLTIGAAVTVLTVLISLPLAYIFNNYRFPGSRFLQSLILVPLIMPPFVGAMGLKNLFAEHGAINLFLQQVGILGAKDTIYWYGLGGGLFGAVLMQALCLYPIMYLNLTAAMANIDPSLEESAMSCGASRWTVLRRVTLPLMVPGFFAGATIVFIWAFTDLGTPLMFNLQQTVPVQIFNNVKNVSENDLGYAMVVLMVLVSVAFFVLSKRMVGRKRYEMLARGHVTGRERKARPVQAAVFLGVILLLLFIALLPHISVFFLSASQSWSNTVLPQGFTAENYKEVFTNPQTSVSIKNSLFYSLLSTVLDIVLGIFIAWLLTRKRFKGSGLLDALVMIPLTLPGIVLAFGYLTTFSGTFLDPRFDPTLLLVLSYGIRRLPYMVRSAYAGFQQTSVTLEEAAQSLGARSSVVMRRITIPLIGGNLIAGMLLCFSYAMVEVSDSLILAWDPDYYPITKAIYDLTESSSSGLACALGMVGMGVLTLAILVAGCILGKKMGELFRTG